MTPMALIGDDYKFATPFSLAACLILLILTVAESNLHTTPSKLLLSLLALAGAYSLTQRAARAPSREKLTVKQAS